MLRSEATLSSSRIDEAIRLSLTCLRANFRTTSDGAAGWYHYLDDPEPGVTASAVGLYCFGLANSHFERTDQVVEYLLGQRVKTPDGDGWAVRTTSGFPIVEATSWVLRALSVPQANSAAKADALTAGRRWLESNQNTDFGWGSYKRQPSRVFTTVLSILALHECGGSSDVIANGQKWLIEAQSQNQAAWGVLPASEPTALHTSISLMALLSVPASLPAAAIRQTADWLFERLEPGEHIEKSSTVEEYNVPYLHNDVMDTFQNSLPHFAGPITVTALLRAGVDPLQAKIFQTVNEIIDSQEVTDQKRSGTWELPRSPLRGSIWSIWPFVAALSSARTMILPSTDTTATLLFTGCAIIQSDTTTRHLTRRLLIKNALLDWLKQRKAAVGLWFIAVAIAVVAIVLWRTGTLTLETFLITLVLPVLLVGFHILWEHRARS